MAGSFTTDSQSLHKRRFLERRAFEADRSKSKSNSTFPQLSYLLQKSFVLLFGSICPHSSLPSRGIWAWLFRVVDSLSTSMNRVWAWERNGRGASDLTTELTFCAGFHACRDKHQSIGRSRGLVGGRLWEGSRSVRPFISRVLSLVNLSSSVVCCFRAAPFCWTTGSNATMGERLG